jgi:hypothetical protein
VFAYSVVIQFSLSVSAAAFAGSNRLNHSRARPTITTTEAMPTIQIEKGPPVSARIPACTGVVSLVVTVTVAVAVEGAQGAVAVTVVVGPVTVVVAVAVSVAVAVEVTVVVA